MGLNITNFTALLKEEFTDQRVANLTYKKNKLLGLLPKSKKFGGTDVKVPLIYGDPQAIGPFTNAQTAKTSTQTSSVAFTLVRRKKYGFVTIDAETIKASEGNDAAFLEAKTSEIEGIFRGISRDLAIDLYRDGTGTLGTIASGVGTPTVTLTNKADARNFEPGMFVNGVNSGATRNSGAKIQITGVDTISGTLTAGGNWTTSIAALANGDTLVRDGCLSTSGSTTGSLPVVDGLAAWVPLSTTPLSSSFYGVTRSASPVRMGGVRYPYSAGEPIEEVLIGLSTLIGAEGGSPDTCLISYENYGSLVKALGAKKTYEVTPMKRSAVMPDGSLSADVGFSGVKVVGPDGDIDIIPDNACPPDRLYMLQMDTWLFRSLGEAPGLLDLDDNKMLREASSDGYEVRIGYYANLQCNAPGWNGVAQLA
jgi:hypothetical protein